MKKEENRTAKAKRWKVKQSKKTGNNLVVHSWTENMKEMTHRVGEKDPNRIITCSNCRHGMGVRMVIRCGEVFETERKKRLFIYLPCWTICSRMTVISFVKAICRSSFDVEFRFEFRTSMSASNFAIFSTGVAMFAVNNQETIQARWHGVRYCVSEEKEGCEWEEKIMREKRRYIFGKKLRWKRDEILCVIELHTNDRGMEGGHHIKPKRMNQLKNDSHTQEIDDDLWRWWKRRQDLRWWTTRGEN